MIVLHFVINDMKQFGQILLFLTGIFAVSCRQTGIVDGAEVRLVSPKEAVSLNCDTVFRCAFPEVLHCCGIQVVNDTVLVFQDQVNDSNPYHFKAYSTNTFEYMGSFIRNGRGPGEMIYPYIVKSSCGDPYLHLDAGQMGKAFSVNVEKSIKTRMASISQSYDLPSNVISWIPMEGIGQFILQLDNSESVFRLIGKDGNISKTFNLYENIDGERYATHLSSILTNDGNKGKVAEFMVFFPQFNMIDTADGLVQSIAVDMNYRKWKTVLNSKLSPDTIQYYEGVTSTPEYIFATYKDVPLSKLNERGLGTYIHVFDWDGNFIYEISVEENIDNIAYDARTGYLYCHEKDEDRIVRYALSGILG